MFECSIPEQFKLEISINIHCAYIQLMNDHVLYFRYVS